MIFLSSKIIFVSEHKINQNIPDYQQKMGISQYYHINI